MREEFARVGSDRDLSWPIPFAVAIAGDRDRLEKEYYLKALAFSNRVPKSGSTCASCCGVNVRKVTLRIVGEGAGCAWSLLARASHLVQPPAVQDERLQNI